MRVSETKALLLIPLIAVACTKKAGERVGKAERKDLVMAVNVSGVVMPARQTFIQSNYAGFVHKLYVSLGAKVKKDAPLVSVSQSLEAREQLFPMRAPYDGTVVQILKREGEAVTAAMGSSETGSRILRLDDLSKFYVASDVAEVDVVRLRVGLEAVIKVSSIPDRTYKGIIREIAMAPREQERWNRGQTEFSSRMEILDADDKLKSGLSAMMDIVTDKKENVVTIPHEFVEADGDKFLVTMANGDRREIKIGARNESDFEVLEGLKEGESVRQVDFLAEVLEKK